MGPLFGFVCIMIIVVCGAAANLTESFSQVSGIEVIMAVIAGIVIIGLIYAMIGWFSIIAVPILLAVLYSFMKEDL